MSAHRQKDRFVHLHTHSSFSFLDGAAGIADLVSSAVLAEMPALAITDHDNLCAAVPFSKTARQAGLKPIIGAELTLEQDYHLILLAQNSSGYANLCRILTEAHLGSQRLKPRVRLDTLRRFCRGLIALSGCRRGEIPLNILRNKYHQAFEAAKMYRSIFGPDHFFLELQNDFLPGTRSLNRSMTELASNLGLRIVATNNVHYAQKDNFQVHDLLTCVRTLTRLEDIHPERRLNAENYLKSAAEMKNIFSEYPDAVKNTEFISEMCEPALNITDRLFPSFPDVPPGETAAAYLRRLTFAGAQRRYGRLSPKVTTRLEHELDIICQLRYEDYFLLVWDAVNYARQNKIRYAGRGSAADSAVAYCLFITEVDSIARGLLFERFMSLERAQKPDIDIDFDSRCRDTISAYLYQKYGADKTATVCTYNTFQARSAFRDLAKAMDFPPAETDWMAKRIPHLHSDQITMAVQRFPELGASGIDAAKFAKLLQYCAEVSGFPRFIGTHLGGIVICRLPLTGVVPLQKSAKGVIVTQYDKDLIEDLGLIKLDLLSLKTMAAIEDAALSIRKSGTDFCYEAIPSDDQATLTMLNKGETIGVFQLESPAQRSLQSRLLASGMEDIIASVALIRPGPIKGNMVEPYIARRHGIEQVTYLHPKLRPILEKTYGVVLFQEQVIEIATVIAGFSPGEADRLRRVMTHARSQREMADIGVEFITKAIANGVSRETAETIFSYITGYASYGFCEAHAAAFGLTAYRTAYMIRHHPAHFFAAVMSHQPMGFYDSNTLCVEARRRGITILPPDINLSQRHFTVEGDAEPYAIRISLQQVKGLKDAALDAILAAREKRPFLSFADFCSRTAVSRDVLENMIRCGVFDSLHPNRKQLLWRSADTLELPQVPDFSPFEKFNFEARILGLNVRCHYMSLWRSKLDRLGFVNCASIARVKAGAHVKIAGLPIRPHRPPTRSGRITAFLSLEDEFGLIDITVFEKAYRESGALLFTRPCPPLKIWGVLQQRGNGLSITARRIEKLTEARMKSSD